MLLSSAGSEEGSGFSFGDLLGGEGAALRDPKREEAVIGGSIPYTVVRASERFWPFLTLSDSF